MKIEDSLVLLFLFGLSLPNIASAKKEDTSSLVDLISPPRGNPNQQCCDSYCCSYCYIGSSSTESWGSSTYWPTAEPTALPTAGPTASPTTGPTSSPTSTYSPPAFLKPEFTKTIYQSALPSWPLAGTTIHLGIHANTTDGSPLRYQLVTTYEFLTLSASQDIIFISNVADGAFVGPNNVMIIEVSAIVIGDEMRSRNAAVVLVFPRSTREENVGVSQDERY